MSNAEETYLRNYTQYSVWNEDEKTEAEDYEDRMEFEREWRDER